jgi:hypothetical protein
MRPAWLERIRPPDRDALAIWLASRVSVWVVAGAAGWMFASSGVVVPLLRRWEQWDFHHYWGIALYGYGGEPTGVPNEAFFPGFPALLWLGNQIGISHVVVGLIVSLVAGAVGAVALARLGELEGGRIVGRYAVLAWVFAPTAVFLAAPYTEALFVAFAFPAWLAARRERWMWAGVLTALSCTVRISGVFLAAALVVQWVVSRRAQRIDDRRWSWSGAGWLFVPALSLLAWSWYLYQQTGDWLAWLTAQSEGWNREFTWPWDAFTATWRAAFGGTQTPEFAWMFGGEIVAMLIGVMLTVALVGWRRWGEATWVGLQVIALGTSTWYFSVPRATLLWWPLWIVIGSLAARRRQVLWGYLAVSVPLMAVWTAAFVTGRWAG